MIMKFICEVINLEGRQIDLHRFVPKKKKRQQSDNVCEEINLEEQKNYNEDYVREISS